MIEKEFHRQRVRDVHYRNQLVKILKSNKNGSIIELGYCSDRDCPIEIVKIPETFTFQKIQKYFYTMNGLKDLTLSKYFQNFFAGHAPPPFPVIHITMIQPAQKIPPNKATRVAVRSKSAVFRVNRTKNFYYLLHFLFLQLIPRSFQKTVKLFYFESEAWLGRCKHHRDLYTSTNDPIV